MAAKRKTSIAVPEPLLRDIDRSAKSRGESRSRFVVRVLAEAVRARRDADITRRINALFAAPEVREDQLRTADDLQRAGVDWASERW